jgi:membrane fusion protein (multidrug efflux system)
MENSEKKKKNPLLFLALIVIGVALFIGVKHMAHAFTHEITDNAQIETYTIPVLSRVAGYVDSILVDDFGNVKKGQALVRVDDREFKLAVAQTEADILTARADLANAEAQQGNASAAVQVAMSNKEVQQIRTDKALNDYNRDKKLLADGSITQKQLDDSKANYETTVKQNAAAADQVNLAKAQTASALAQLNRAKAAIETRQAMLDQMKLKLSYALINAPVAGKIGKRNLTPGQYIQPGQTLFTIVDNESFWVIANFKETQLKNISIGKPVTIILDGYSDRSITGKVSSYSDATGARFALLPPDNATGNFIKVTQRVPVKIEIDDIEKYKDILKAGLSVTVEIKI